MPSVMLSASLLAANPLRLESQVRHLLSSSCQIDRLHVDAMDGYWVADIFPGALLCQALRACGIQAPIDIHLMLVAVQQQVEASIAAGATTVWFHPQVLADKAIERALCTLREAQVGAGLALSPEVPWTSVKKWSKWVNDWLVLAVTPGACGQSFKQSTFDKIKTMQDDLPEDACITVDGGVGLDNAQHLVNLGVHSLVVGSGLFDKNKTVLSDVCTKLAAICHNQEEIQ